MRVGEKPTTTEELIAMPLINLNMDGMEVITLGDVADVFMTDNSADIYTNVDGSAGVMVSMQKQTGYSTGDVSNKINDKFEEMMEEKKLRFSALKFWLIPLKRLMLNIPRKFNPKKITIIPEITFTIV